MMDNMEFRWHFIYWKYHKHTCFINFASSLAFYMFSFEYIYISITGSMYYVSFIDDFSCKTWIYFLKTKDEVFSRFQEFKALVENQTRKKIKVLRSDNGGEYTSKEFEGFCKEAGIKRELIVPYNPQQNGVAERKNRSIIGVAKAMIHDQDLSMFLWAEACNTTVYIQNQCPHRILEDKTPEEAFTGVKPRGESFSHLWLSSLYPCTSREEDQVGALQQEGFICGLQ
jgi:transposase InsO family protein